MKVIISFENNVKEFTNSDTILIGCSSECDFVVSELAETEVLKLVYAEKYNNYVLLNVSQSRDILCNNKVFSKILVTPRFTISSPKL